MKKYLIYAYALIFLACMTSAADYANYTSYGGVVDYPYVIAGTIYNWTASIAGTNITAVTLGGFVMGHNNSCDDYSPYASSNTATDYCVLLKPEQLDASFYSNCSDQYVDLIVTNFNETNASSGTAFTNTTSVQLNASIPCVSRTNENITPTGATGYTLNFQRVGQMFDQLMVYANTTYTKGTPSSSTYAPEVTLFDASAGYVRIKVPTVAYNATDMYAPYGYHFVDAQNVIVQPEGYINESSPYVIEPGGTVGDSAGLIVVGVALGGLGSILYRRVRRRSGEDGQP